MAIQSCPSCGKKLNIPDASVGKKMKCKCGNVFVAKGEDPAPAKAAAPAATADKVIVACTECDAKLKVAPTSLGKRLKCSKCAAVFVAAVEESTPPPRKTAPVKADDEDVDPPAPAKKGKAV